VAFHNTRTRRRKPVNHYSWILCPKLALTDRFYAAFHYADSRTNPWTTTHDNWRNSRLLRRPAILTRTGPRRFGSRVNDGLSGKRPKNSSTTNWGGQEPISASKTNIIDEQNARSHGSSRSSPADTARSSRGLRDYRPPPSHAASASLL